MNQLVPVAPAMTVSDVERVALAIAKGGLFGSKDPNAVLTLCLLAQAEGQHPAVVFRDYHIISGKPAKKAEAMLRDFINAGGKVEWHQLDDTCADATFSHPAGSARIAWDHERAQKAQLAGNAMYKKYPRQMLRSRVISEGIRTVYPGATSGLYEESEVASFAATDAPQNPETGEIIEAEAIREPAAREKLDGPHTSKTALRNAINDVIKKARDAVSVRELDAIKEEHKHTINQARRDWPMLIDGDPRIEEDIGLKGVFEMKRAELSFEPSENFTMCLETLETCTSTQELDAWFKLNSKYVETLDGEESRRIQARYDELEAGLKAAEVVRA